MIDRESITLFAMMHQVVFAFLFLMGRWSIVFSFQIQSDCTAMLVAVYRPMGIAMGPDGSLYIAETEKGKIWRIMYKGNKDSLEKKQLATIDKVKKFNPKSNI